MTDNIVVMVVDDDPAVLKGFGQLLPMLLKECEVLVAGSKAEAEAHAGKRSIDVTLIDGLDDDGPLLVKNLLESGRGGKLVACTSDYQLRAEMMSLGCVAYLEKPVSARRMVELVKQLATSPT